MEPLFVVAKILGSPRRNDSQLFISVAFYGLTQHFQRKRLALS